MESQSTQKSRAMTLSITEWTYADRQAVPARPEGLPLIPYVRVSTEKQKDEGVSLSVQQVAIAEWARERGLTLGDVVIDVKSAESIFKRPVLVDLLDKTLNNEVGGVIVFDSDRLARSGSVMHEMIVEPFKKSGRLFEVHSVEIEDSATGNLLRRILESVKQFERERIAERTRRTMQWKKSQGKAVGMAPYGFNYEQGDSGSVQKDVFVPEWPEYGVWLYIRGLVAGCSTTIENMVELLTSEGIPPPAERGAGWRLNNVHRIVSQICRHEEWPTKRGPRLAALSDEARDDAMDRGRAGLARAKEMLVES